MRVFKSACKDDKTGYEMILSEVSYNMACDWLSRELAKHDYEICGTEQSIRTGLMHIFTSRTSIDTGDLLDDESPIGMYYGRTFYYDETRGYLLGE